MHLSVVIPEGYWTPWTPSPPQHLHNDIYKSPKTKISPRSASITSLPGATVGSDEDYSHKVQCQSSRDFHIARTYSFCSYQYLYYRVAIKRGDKRFANLDQQMQKMQQMSAKLVPCTNMSLGLIPRGGLWYITYLVKVLEAILMSRQPFEKLQCLYENLMLNNFHKMPGLKNMNCQLKLHSKGFY